MKDCIFKPCDIRGVYPNELNEEAVYRIARACGTLAESSDVILAGDVRLSTPSLKEAAARGLMDAGCVVHDLGIVPTPVFYYARRRLGINPGLMITASHNPPHYNGVKIVLGELPITEREMESIKNLAMTEKVASGRGRILKREIVSDYEDWMLRCSTELLQGAESLPKVVVDCGNGCYSEIAPRVLERAGLRVVPVFCEVDGTFPNRSPNSALPENLSELRAAVVSTGANFGIAFDGDGDRVSFVDEHGAFVIMDKAIAVLAANLPSPLSPGDKVVLDIKCSAAVSDTVRALGAVPITEKSGHAYIKTRMIRERARFGGEISGHFFYQDLNSGDDGLYTALLMAGTVARKGPLSELAAHIPSYATTPDIRLHIDSEPHVILDAIANAFTPEQVSRLDGVRVQLVQGWGLIRASVTEPVITLRFEGKTPEALRKVIEQILAPTPEIRQMVLERWVNISSEMED
ncbi:MAG: phosphomannomutase/phosphoglucomutase [Armatimonadota bacterium]|nr:phosphomannomutase/phosphoglucomutase [Armatimonadota bacterium]